MSSIHILYIPSQCNGMFFIDVSNLSCCIISDEKIAAPRDVTLTSLIDSNREDFTITVRAEGAY